MPFNDIHVGNVYSNPAHRGFGKFSGLEWVVIDIDDTEKIIKVQPVTPMINTFGKPMWKKASDRMFTESWLVHKGAIL